jgi:RES domain
LLDHSSWAQPEPSQQEVNLLRIHSADPALVCTPSTPVFRIGRRPSPWLPPDWTFAHDDGTFGNRFDDPQAYYRVLYASSQRVSCFIETLARFRPDLQLVAELAEIEGDDDFVAVGTVPSSWLDSRIMGKATVSGRFADIYSNGWVAILRRELASDALALGLDDIDVSVLQQATPRIITQKASRMIYQNDYDGIFYRSRYGHDLDNWAIFEPFSH